MLFLNQPQWKVLGEAQPFQVRGCQRPHVPLLNIGAEPHSGASTSCRSAGGMQCSQCEQMLMLGTGCP